MLRNAPNSPTNGVKSPPHSSQISNPEPRAAPQLPRDVGDIISMMENWDSSHSPPAVGAGRCGWIPVKHPQILRWMAQRHGINFCLQTSMENDQLQPRRQGDPSTHNAFPTARSLVMVFPSSHCIFLPNGKPVPARGVNGISCL